MQLQLQLLPLKLLPVDNSPDFRCVSVLQNNKSEISWDHLAGAPPSTVYSVFHSDNPNGPFIFLDSIMYPINTYIHNNSNANITSQYYYISSHSSCASESLPSDTLKSIYLNHNSLDFEKTMNNIHIPGLITSLDFNILALNSFLGESLQKAPFYSALKHKGKPLYKYAREGELIEKPPREIKIIDISNIHFQNPLLEFELYYNLDKFFD